MIDVDKLFAYQSNPAKSVEILSNDFAVGGKAERGEVFDDQWCSAQRWLHLRPTHVPDAVPSCDPVLPTMATRNHVY